MESLMKAECGRSLWKMMKLRLSTSGSFKRMVMPVRKIEYRICTVVCHIVGTQ